MPRKGNRKRKQRRSAKQKQIFRLPENRGQEDPPRDAGESLCWILASACDFAEVNHLAETLQISRAPGNAEEIRQNREIITREGNETFDLRVRLEIARAYHRKETGVLLEREVVDEILVEHESGELTETEIIEEDMK